MSTSLKDKTAIVTGGASGIGAGVVELFVKEGANVVIADVQIAAGEALAKRLGASAKFVETDVTKTDQIEECISIAVDSFGGLDVMMNNAGISGDMQYKAFLDEDYSDFDRVMHVDVLGVMLGTRLAAKWMSENGGGSIINTASTAGFFAGHGIPIYRAAKSAVINYTENAAMSLGEYGIRVNAISPGPIETPILGSGIDLPEEKLADLSRKIMEVIMEPQPLKRMGQPEDIAKAAVFLASDNSLQISGLNLVVGGGSALGDPIDRTALMQNVFASVMAEAAKA